MLSNVSAFLLHRKPFRESSQWVSLFTYECGRLAAIYRPSGRRKWQQVLAPFQALVVDVAGEGELKTLRGAEDPCPPLLLSGVACYAGWYVNELLYRLLPPQEPYPRLFDCYADLLLGLMRGTEVAPSLRAFEATLLRELGYGLNLQPDPELQPERDLQPERALQPALPASGPALYFDAAEGRVVSGHGSHGAQPAAAGGLLGPLDVTLLRAAAQGDWAVSGAGALARRLHGARIDHILDGRPLHARELLKNYLEVGFEKKGTPGS